MSEQEQAIQKEENSTVDNLSITTIRTLAIDAIEKRIPAIQVCQWVLHQWATNCLQKQ